MLDRWNHDFAQRAASHYCSSMPLELHAFAAYGVAQLYAESAFRPNAVSPKGAAGVAQIMPGTARDLGYRPHDRFDVAASLEMWTKLLIRNYNHLRSPKRLQNPPSNWGAFGLAVCGYNCGIGYIDLQYVHRRINGKRQRVYCASHYLRQEGLPLTIENVLAVLPQVTGESAKETQTYWRRIVQFKPVMTTRFGI